MPGSQGEGVAPLLPVCKDQEDTAAGTDVHKAAVVHHAAEQVLRRLAQLRQLMGHFGSGRLVENFKTNIQCATGKHDFCRLAQPGFGYASPCCPHIDLSLPSLASRPIEKKYSVEGNGSNRMLSLTLPFLPVF